MSVSISNTSKKKGLPPGSLVHVGDVTEMETRISVIRYGRESFTEQFVQDGDETLQGEDNTIVTWINVEGLANVEIVSSIGRVFNIHPLVLEDVLNTQQRPKLEEHEDYLYIVLKSLWPGEGFSVCDEQVSIIIRNGCVITFKEKNDALFVPIIERIKNSKSRFRTLKEDYLAYAILDTIIDQNFVVVDALEEAVTAVEDDVFTNPVPETMNRIQELKREIIHLRRYISPVREVAGGLIHSESILIRKETHIYLRDLLDHILRVIESIEIYREILSGLTDIYISGLSNKMNEVMKVLTVFASIFIPLTFLAGIYGMNFEYMPELQWRWAYPAIWGVFVAIPTGLLLFFKKKRWI